MSEPVEPKIHAQSDAEHDQRGGDQQGGDQVVPPIHFASETFRTALTTAGDPAESMYGFFYTKLFEGVDTVPRYGDVVFNVAINGFDTMPDIRSYDFEY